MRTFPLVAVPTLAFILACGSGSDATPTVVVPDATPAAASLVDAKGQLVAYTGRFANDPLLTPADVAMLATDELKFTRNEIFARYGRAFATPDMREHFAPQHWYTTDEGYADSRLTANDKANIALITSFEDKSKDPVAVGQFQGDALVMFVDASSAVIDPSGGMYEEMRTTVHWATRGDWLITWEDGFTTWTPGDTGMKNPTLWKLDFANKSVKQVAQLVT